MVLYLVQIFLKFKYNQNIAGPTPCMQTARGAKSVGTWEPGSQKVDWPAESFWTKPIMKTCLQKKSADN